MINPRGLDTTDQSPDWLRLDAPARRGAGAGDRRKAVTSSREREPGFSQGRELVWARAEGVRQPTMAGACWMRVSSVTASTMKRA